MHYSSIALLCVFNSLSPLSVHAMKCDFCERVIYPKDADVDKQFCDFAISSGFHCETHYVTTEDGYILSLFRINKLASNAFGKPCLFVHAFFTSATEFIMNAPGDGTQFGTQMFHGKKVSNNMGYALAMFGYDVWFINCRGSEYSTNHTTLNTNSRKFWEFSQDEKIKYDLPETITYIQKLTNRRKISAIGHSQGTTLLFGLLASSPKYNDVIDVCLLLAPVARIQHTKSLLFSLPQLQPIPALGYVLGGPFPLGYKQNSEIASTITRNCPLVKTVLVPSLNALVHGPSNQLNESRLHVYGKNIGGESLWSGVRYIQHPSEFKYFDYGPIKNKPKYGSEYAPSYQLNQITTDVCLISGSNDYVADQEDVNFIRDQLGPRVKYDFVIEANHIDFVISYEASKTCKKILQVLADY